MVFQRSVRREFAQSAAGVFVALFAIMVSIQAIRLLGDAAKGEDVQLRASAFLADIASRHAEFHEGDALMAEGF